MSATINVALGFVLQGRVCIFSLQVVLYLDSRESRSARERFRSLSHRVQYVHPTKSPLASYRPFRSYTHYGIQQPQHTFIPHHTASSCSSWAVHYSMEYRNHDDWVASPACMTAAWSTFLSERVCWSVITSHLVIMSGGSFCHTTQNSKWCQQAVADHGSTAVCTVSFTKGLMAI